MTTRTIAQILSCALLCGNAGLRGQAEPMDRIVVTALRGDVSPDADPFSTRVLSGEALRDAPALTLDSALRTVPGFSLFRRSDSLTAHPTTQGVSLRGLGPSGASRSLVVLNGIPVNDPFGGWVDWASLPRESLARAEIVSGGGATAWGDSALGGVLQLLTEEVAPGSGRLVATLGDFQTRSAEWIAAEGTAATTLELSGRLFSTGGYRTVAPERRGPVDQSSDDRHRWFTARWRQRVSANTTATLTAKLFHDARDNGTPYQENTTDEQFVSAEVATKASRGFRWTASAYGLDEKFASTYGAVNATRTVETPASDQYDVPASAGGAAWTGEWGDGLGEARTIAGADARWVRGESRENFFCSNGAYTRRRAAGGRQSTGGVFVLHERPLSSNVAATLGSRLDYWEDASGVRREQDIVSGKLLRDDRFPKRSGTEWSPSAGLTWRVADGAKLRLSGQHAFRRPTLNELYRPFRVGSVITEANPALGTETVDTVEAGAEWARGPFSGTVTAYWNELHGAVSNVTEAHGPGTFPLLGVIPAGGLGRQRQNLDRVRVRGVELSGRWQGSEHLALTAEALANDAEVTKAKAAPGLVGLRVAQVPRFSGSLGLAWRQDGWQVSPRARWLGAQFEDDENLLRLAPAVVVDCSVSRALNARADLFLTVENLFNERIETGRSAAGVINVGTRRFATGGVRWNW